ncbi:MAG: manganese catalase family protein [Lachnospiraceae bacterium]|nr:manganese catalase family protein [Lachnospiraceae bacterium]
MAGAIPPLLLYKVMCHKCLCFLMFQMCNIDTKVGTEEMAHEEIISSIVHQLTINLTAEQIEGTPFANYYVDHTLGIYPASATGEPWTAAYVQSKGDPITDLHEDLAADGTIL